MILVTSYWLVLFLVRTILSRKFKKNVWWCTHVNSSFKTKEILSLLLIRWICLNSRVLEAATKRRSTKKMLLKLFYKNICETLVKLLCIYNAAKDELLLKYFRRKFLYLLVANFGICKQLVLTLKHYSEKKFSLIKSTLKHVCFKKFHEIH